MKTVKPEDGQRRPLQQEAGGAGGGGDGDRAAAVSNCCWLHGGGKEVLEGSHTIFYFRGFSFLAPGLKGSLFCVC